MDLFERFGITSEIQQFVTLFSLVFTLVFPLVRWGLLPLVNKVFKRRPDSELFQLIKNRIEDKSTRVEGNWLVSGKLRVDGVDSHEPFVKLCSDGHDYVLISSFLTKGEKKRIFCLAAKKVKEDMERKMREQQENVRLALQLVSEDKCFPSYDQIRTTDPVHSPIAPHVESSFTSQENVETAQPTQGVEPVNGEVAGFSIIGEIVKQNDRQFEMIQKLRKELTEEREKHSVTKLFETIREYREERDKLKIDLEAMSKQYDEVHNEWKYYKGANVVLLSHNNDAREALVEADKVIKNQQELIDNCKKDLEESQKSYKTAEQMIERLKSNMKDAVPPVSPGSTESYIIKNQRELLAVLPKQTAPTLNIPKQT